VERPSPCQRPSPRPNPSLRRGPTAELEAPCVDGCASLETGRRQIRTKRRKIIRTGLRRPDTLPLTPNTLNARQHARLSVQRQEALPLQQCAVVTLGGVQVGCQYPREWTRQARPTRGHSGNGSAADSPAGTTLAFRERGRTVVTDLAGTPLATVTRLEVRDGRGRMARGAST
jgi:hypothetical protein